MTHAELPQFGLQYNSRVEMFETRGPRQIHCSNFYFMWLSGFRLLRELGVAVARAMAAKRKSTGGDAKKTAKQKTAVATCATTDAICSWPLV